VLGRWRRSTRGARMSVFGAALVAAASLATPASATSSVTSRSTHNALRRASGCGSPAMAGTTTETLDVAGAPRQFRLAVPSEPTGKRSLPLILNFHASGGNDVAQAVVSQLEEKGPAHGFVVVTPNAGDPPQWNVPPGPTSPQRFEPSDANLAFTNALVKNAAARLCIDMSRLYATGLSNGAFMTASLGCKFSPRLAAIAPVAGVNGTEPCPHGKPMSVRFPRHRGRLG
jgi:polyhydroxybutyrate depolymerase